MSSQNMLNLSDLLAGASAYLLHRYALGEGQAGSMSKGVQNVGFSLLARQFTPIGGAMLVKSEYLASAGLSAIVDQSAGLGTELTLKDAGIAGLSSWVGDWVLQASGTADKQLL